MANAWLTHVKSTMASMRKAGTYKKGDGLKKVIHAAKKTYKKTRRGSKKGRRGGDPPAAATESYEVPAAEGQPGDTQEAVPPNGGRRRSTRRRARR